MTYMLLLNCALKLVEEIILIFWYFRSTSSMVITKHGMENILLVITQNAVHFHFLQSVTTKWRTREIENRQYTNDT